jgi:predicted glycosyltransferase
MKNFLIDIGHPAHIHLYKNIFYRLSSKGANIIVTTREIKVAIELLKTYEIPFINLGKKRDSLFGKILDVVYFNWRIYCLVRKNNIDIAIGTTINIAHVSRFTRVTSFVFDDDDSAVQPLMARYGHPFADFILSPDVLDYERSAHNHITYPSYHELAYLHPDVFVPEKRVLRDLDLEEGEKYFILRFNAFKAHHDNGVSGLDIRQKRDLIQGLLKHGKVFITSERNLDEEFLQYQISISPEDMHSFIFYAFMLIGDSQTMSSEAAVLGTPSLRCNSFAGKISYLEELEKRYELTYAFLPSQYEALVAKLTELLSSKNLKEVFALRRKRMLEDKISTTSFIEKILESYS